MTNAENPILASLFQRSLSLERRPGGAADTRALSLWGRMADRLDEIAANTRGGCSTLAAAVLPSRAFEAGNSLLSPAGSGTARRRPSHEPLQGPGAARSVVAGAGQDGGHTSDRGSRRTTDGRGNNPSPKTNRDASRASFSAPAGAASTAVPTRSQQASASGREERAIAKQGRIIADAVMGGMGKFGSFGRLGMEAVKEDSNARDAAGYALAGPLFGVAKELREAIPDSLKERFEGRKEGHAGQEGGQKRDAKGRFLPDRDTVRRETAQIEIAADGLDLQAREARAEEKRHKELVRAIRASNRGGLSDRLTGGLRGRDRIIREGGGTGRSRDVDVGRGRARSRVPVGAKGALGAARAIPVAGQLLAAGMALYDGFQGWNDTAMQRQAFGIAEGQEASTGQKASTAIASVLDMGGLATGLLGLLGVDVDTADIARNIYSAGTAIAVATQDFVASFSERAASLWGGISDFASRVWTSAQEAGGALSAFAGSVVEQGTSLLSSLWDGARSAIGGIWVSLENFAQESIAGAGEMLSSLWKTVSNLPGQIADGAKDIASGAIAEGGKLLSAGRDAIDAGVAWAGEKASSAWEGAKEAASSGWDTVSAWGSRLLKELGPSEVQAAELPALPAVGTGLISSGVETQEEMNEAMSSVNEAMQEQNKLLSSIDKSLNTMPDTYGIAGALGGVRDAIRDVRTGGNGGYVRTGASGTAPGFAYNPDSKIGDTVAHEESGTDGIRAIGYDRTGGTSYGKWQLSSKQGSLEEWLQLLESKGGEAAAVAKRLRAAGPTNTGGRSGAFVDAYLQEASANSELFENTQRESLLKHNYNPAMSLLQSDSLRQMILSDKSLQEMMFSTAVQHGGGGAAKIFNGVYREGMSREDLIRAVYARRGGQFGSSSAQVQQSVRNRMERERDLILGMNRGEANARSLRASMAKGGTEAVQAGVSSMIAEATEDAKRRNVKYKMKAKDSASGAIDCSGWVYEMSSKLMAGMNAAMGQDVFSAEARQALRKGAADQGAAGIVRAVSEQTGQLLTNEQLTPELAKEGMVIGLDTGPASDGRDRTRFRGIDHVVQTYRDPVTGELMVSESRGGKGVMSSRYADWYAAQQKRGTKLFGADLVAMADASKVAPAQPASIAGSSADVPSAPAALAESAVSTAPPQSSAKIFAGAGNAQSGLGVEHPESVRTILPSQALQGGASGDNRALLAMLGKILAAIESGNRKAGSMASGNGGGVPSISMDYDDPSVRGMALDL